MAALPLHTPGHASSAHGIPTAIRCRSSYTTHSVINFETIIGLTSPPRLPSLRRSARSASQIFFPFHEPPSTSRAASHFTSRHPPREAPSTSPRFMKIHSQLPKDMATCAGGSGAAQRRWRIARPAPPQATSPHAPPRASPWGRGYDTAVPHSVKRTVTILFYHDSCIAAKRAKVLMLPIEYTKGPTRYSTPPVSPERCCVQPPIASTQSQIRKAVPARIPPPRDAGLRQGCEALAARATL